MFQTDPFSLIVLFVGLSLLPFVAMVATSYLKIVVVMSLIRNALGIQSIPPNMVINALAMILTFYIMAPICSESWTIAKTELAKAPQTAAAASPEGGSGAAGGSSADGRWFETDALEKAAEPFRRFLSDHTSARERAFFINTAETLWGKDGNPATVDPESYYILLPSFCVSELTKSFQIGFLVYLPFIAIDIIVSNILLAMGMMMVSPVTISLPFKLLLFVMVNGWTLLIQGLVRGYLL
ncbi:MAG: EscR/YscR/HrcR family type III secretion system export apparatus protein [Kiritimatiellae bacterium]|nr:EscR/YscR/HrcR family type III secretion system export apparatus protein [Kiritimatiellia bacterium]